MAFFKIHPAASVRVVDFAARKPASNVAHKTQQLPRVAGNLALAAESELDEAQFSKY
jgi:hypothetical protein